MRQARIVSVSISRPCGEVYDYLADPRNYAEWGGIEPDTLLPLATGEWQAMTQFGSRRVRFTPRNEHGVADLTIIRDDGTATYTPMRVVPNDEGTELMFTYFQADGMGETEVVSALEWITTDLQVLKSLLESRSRS